MYSPEVVYQRFIAHKRECPTCSAVQFDFAQYVPDLDGPALLSKLCWRGRNLVKLWLVREQNEAYDRIAGKPKVLAAIMPLAKICSFLSARLCSHGQSRQV